MQPAAPHFVQAQHALILYTPLQSKQHLCVLCIHNCLICTEVQLICRILMQIVSHRKHAVVSAADQEQAHSIDPPFWCCSVWSSSGRHLHGNEQE